MVAIKKGALRLFRLRPSALLGALIRPFIREEVRTEILKGYFSYTGDSNRRSFLSRLIVAHHDYAFYRSDIHKKRSTVRALWGGRAGSNWHNRPIAFNSNNYRVLLQQLANLVETYPAIDTLIEVGVGSGKLLKFISEQVKLTTFVGIDLNERQIRSNRATLGLEHLEFHNLEIVEYLSQIKGHNVILLRTHYQNEP